jgi:hypothetical protein
MRKNFEGGGKISRGLEKSNEPLVGVKEVWEGTKAK